MITTSTGYKNAVVKNGRTWKAKVVINGTEYTEFSRFEYVNTIISENHITIGEAVTSTLDFTLDTTDTIFKEGRSLEAYIGLILENQTIEWVKIGVFHITKRERDDTTLKVTAQDNMCLTTKGFFTNLSGTQKISAILTEQCNKLGFSYAGGADDVSVNVNLLSGYTVREVFGILASYCGKNATIDRDGNLKLTWFSDISLNVGADKFQDPLTLAEEDTFINKITCVINDEEQVNAGVGIGISFSNPLMTANRLSVLYNKIKAFTYRSCTVNMILGRPDLEVGDIITVTDKRGRVYKVPIMSQGISFDGGVSCKIESKGKTEIEQETEIRGNLTTRVDRTVSDLTVTKKLLADTIEAYSGEFETINTNYLEVIKKLTALDAEIENLDVTELTAKVAIIETSYVSKEYVQDLYATKAEVHVLDVDLERVNTLLAGSVTAGSTQTIVLNADNTTISNALIKSAMIDSVAADKVTAGTIDASSIHFKSQSGRLDIFGETLQIKDITRPRVQIGKDASGDYNMYVWDASGKLMFDATGITASGIQRPIIVDSMVADNANISGDKINITSLVKEINDGTEVIKSSHILVDGANQSLSVVYNTITGDISTLSTALSVEQGKVSSLITDVSQAKGDVSTLQTNYSSLTQTVSGINSTVSSHTSSIDALNNMEIGGVNLLVIKTAIKGKYLNKSGEEVIEGGWFYSDYISVSGLKNLTTSGYSNLGISPSVCYYDSSKNFIKGINNNGQSKAQHIAIESGIAYIRFSGMIKDIPTLKIEKGTKATNYSPAPEDVDASIKTVSDKTSTLEQTVNGFSGRISAVETTANNASSKVTEITATVDGLTTTVANKTDKGAIISTINQSAEAIKIQASKLELTGSVTISMLDPSLQSTVNTANDLSNKAFWLAMAASQGRMVLNDPTFLRGTNGISVYNNSGNGTVTIAREAKTSGWTYDTPYRLKISNNGTASPGFGGFVMGFGNVKTWHTYIYRIIANVPKGRTLNFTRNSAGTNPDEGWLTSRDGTNQWTEYVYRLRAGEGTTSTCGHFYITGGSAGFSWYVVYATVFDLGTENLLSTMTQGTTQIHGSYIQTGTVTANQIAANTITAAKIASGTITATQIAANTITGAKIASKTITADKISVTSLSALTANLGTVTAGSLTSNTTISVSTNLTVGNNIYLNQNVNTTKFIYFNSSNYIRNLYTNSYNYITVNSNYRCALISGSASVYAYGNSGSAGISANGDVLLDTNSGAISFGISQVRLGFYKHSDGSFCFRGNTDYGPRLGSPSYRFYNIYLKTSPNVSSDIRLKTNIKKYDKRFEDMYMDLRPITYDLLSEPNKSHGGLIAQWTKESMNKYGISEAEFGVYNYDAGCDDYGLAYTELTSLNMHMIQKTIKRVDAIDDELLSIKVSRQQDAQELQQELQKRDFEISQLQHRIQQLESRS
ncbi:tail fiber domain-containing protein [[Clostridium] innocuum]|nr:tail fiber domain-containing protein [[Clostridium] innocuum]MCR0575892.1 tail fiber domain-containing protein [[Clostridium] innocuum]